MIIKDIQDAVRLLHEEHHACDGRRRGRSTWASR
jgi:hypothetical protein